MQYCLLICDMQHDILGYLPDGPGLAERIAQYVIAAKERYRRVYMGGCWHPPDLAGHFDVEDPNFGDTFPAHCLAGTAGAGWAGALAALKEHELSHGYYYKGQFLAPAMSMFEAVTLAKGYTLDMRLKYFGITHVDVVGADLDGGVYQTALNAVALGYQTRILADLTQRYQALTGKPSEVMPNCERYGIGYINSKDAWAEITPEAKVPAPGTAGDYAGIAANINDNF